MKKIAHILNYIHIIFSILILGTLIVFGYLEVGGEIRKNLAYNNVQEALKNNKANPQPCFNEEGIVKKCPGFVMKDVIRATVGLSGVSKSTGRELVQDHDPYPVENFKPGNVGEVLFFHVFYLFVAVASLYGLKVWAKWMVQNDEEELKK